MTEENNKEAKLKIINLECPVCWKKLKEVNDKKICTNNNCLTNHGVSEL